MPEFFDQNPSRIDNRFEVDIFDRTKIVPPPIPDGQKRYRGILKDHQKGVAVHVEADTLDELHKLLSEKRREES